MAFFVPCIDLSFSYSLLPLITASVVEMTFFIRLRLSLWRRKYDIGLLRDKKDKSFWVDHSVVPIVNAFYDPSVNGMEFPAGILQVY